MKKMVNPPLPPLLVIPLGIAAVSTASIWIRLAQESAGSLTIAAFRLGLAVILLSPHVLLNHRKDLGLLSRRDFSLTLLAGLLLAVHFASWITSLEYTTVASSVVLVSTTPLWVAAASPLLLGEKTNRAVLMGMLLALGGGGIVAVSDSCTAGAGQLVCPSLERILQGRAFRGDFLALLGAISGAGYLMIGRHLRGKFALAPYIFLVYGTAAVYLTAGMLVVDGVPAGLPSRVYLYFLLLAVFPQLLGHSVFNWALRYLPAGYVSVTLLGEPIGSTILAYIFLKEKPVQLKIIGAILILVGIGIASFRPKDSKHPPPDGPFP